MTVNAGPTQAGGLLANTTSVVLRPRFEGCNICTWIGFKHVNYLVEEAVLEHFRGAGLPAGGLFETYGLGLDIVALDTRILHALHLDDAVEANIRPQPGGGEAGLAFRVTLSVPRHDAMIKAVTSRVAVVLRPDGYIEPGTAAPPWLEPFTVRRLGGHMPPPPPPPPGPGPGPGAGTAPRAEAGNAALRDGRTDPVLAQLTGRANAFGWKWRIPYIYCHFSERLQMSGYLRQMEEAADLFLAARGISIKRLLDERRWIPVVPSSRIQILDEVVMEEDLYTVYTVEEILKDLTYTSRMDCYVVRGGTLVHTATGAITHGYAAIENRRDWRLVAFGDRVLAALSDGSLPGQEAGEHQCTTTF